MDWHERYRSRPRPFGDAPTPAVRVAFEDPSAVGLSDLLGPTSRPLRVLCPADGYGRNGRWIAALGHRVEACDLVPSAVADAARLADGAALPYRTRVADLTAAEPFAGIDGPFDLIVSAWTHIPDDDARARWHENALTMLAPGGALVVVTSPSVITAAQERREWPSISSWTEHSIENEIRLIGRIAS